MSQSNLAGERTGIASESLASAKYHIVQLDASAGIEIGEGNTDLLVGVLQNKPADGLPAIYRFQGTTKLVAGGVISIGDWITAKSDGRGLTTTTDGDVVIGRALEAAATDGDIIEVQLSIQHLYIA